MKKQYGVANIDQKEYTESANDLGSSSAVHKPLVKIDDGEGGAGFNAKMIAGEFALPPASECKEATLEVAHRILGLLVTKDLLAHLPQTVTAEHLGNLLPFYPMSYHKRFGATYTDRVCPGSTRTGRCPVCTGRKDLFTSDAYKSGVLAKDSIMKAGFGTRQVALVVSRVYFNGEDMGIRVWTTAITNEQAANAKHDNFFDLVAQLTTPKKLLAGETLPVDYYSNGDGARWLVAEYVRATYSEDSKPGEQKSKRPPAPYWKLSKVTPTKEIPGVGKAVDIWWPEFGKGKDAKDGTELVDVYGLINHTPIEELEEITKEAVARVLNPRKQNETAAPADKAAGGEAAGEAAAAEDLEAPTWGDIVSMEVDELVRYGVAKGGKAKDLELTGATNIGALRRCVAKLWSIAPKAVAQPTQSADESEGRGEEDLLF